MRILVLGATGGIGEHCIREALARGHAVTGVGRAPKGPDIAGLAYVQGDVFNPDSLAKAMQGHDAVASALGARGAGTKQVMQQAARATLQAMQRTGVQRLVVVSAGMLFPGLVTPVVRYFLRDAANDCQAMEAQVQSSAVDWTVVRPPRLTADTSRAYRWKVNAMPSMGLSMGRLGVAVAMLDALEQKLHTRQIIGLSK